MKLDRVNLVGNSFGTRVAQCFAVHYPGRIIKLAMTGTGIGPRGMSEEDKQKIIATREAQIAKGGYAFGARVNALLAANASPETIELVREVVRATNPRGFMHRVKLGLVDGYAPEEVAPKLNFPVLMISGREDRVNPIDKNAAVLIKQMPKAGSKSSKTPGICRRSRSLMSSTRCYENFSAESDGYISRVRRIDPGEWERCR